MKHSNENSRGDRPIAPTLNQNNEKKLTLAFSPCPNDTFIFYALVNGSIDCEGYEFETFLNDVETLNKKAFSNTYNITKLSFAALGHVLNKYSLLKSGGALGKGCGPLLVSRKGLKLDDIKKQKIAVPGIMTTAYLLLSLFLEKKPNAKALSFEKIMPAVKSKEFDFGVIIHEGRFTYKEYGLECLMDLGEWWEKKTSLPIPLGCIAIEKKLGKKTADTIEKLIKNSILYAFENKEETAFYIKKYAQEMDDKVIEQHINLYVNDFSIDMGKTGELAVKTLFDMAS
jgi:1,4-dihydroxy-6-naphthoate synthase